MDLRVIAWVALGGALGAVARYLVSITFNTDAFPYGTLAVNAIGSLLIGFLVFQGLGEAHGPALRVLVGVGFLGAFTTMSAFSLETMHLHAEGRAGMAFLNIALNLGLSLAAVWVGRSAAIAFAPAAT